MEKGLTREVPARTVGAEMKAISGEPDATEEVAHAHDDRTAPDLQTGQPGNRNSKTPKGVAHAEPDPTPGEEADSNAPAHLEVAGPEVLMEEENDRSLGVERMGPPGKPSVSGSSRRTARA